MINKRLNVQMILIKHLNVQKIFKKSSVVNKLEFFSESKLCCQRESKLDCQREAKFFLEYLTNLK